ncbi:hemolysin family protein [Halovulum sp. GXIMD14793]
MGENSEGSSAAAQSAQDSDTPPQKSRLFGWLLRGPKPAHEAEPAFGSASDIAAASEGARDMLINVRNMRDVRLYDVAVPRADIVAVPETATLDEVVQAFRDSTYSRLPVYAETLDNPLGLVHLKDLALAFGFQSDQAAFNLKAVMRPLLYAPPSMPMGVMLQKMQSDRMHMALVIDEYGGVDGLVTIEDLVEQIVGEIADEHDAEEGEMWQDEGDGAYLCQARAPLEDFEAIAGVDLLSDDLDEDVDTIGGLVFMLAGRVPQRGEVVLHSQGHELEVVEADPRSIKRVRVRINKAAKLDQAAE